MKVYSSLELAKLLGVSKNTLLRWEESKLIPEALRDGRGWRLWNKEHLHKILEFKNTVYGLKKAKVSDLRISIIGYGNQAKVWASILKTEGIKPKILLRKESITRKEAVRDGFEVKTIEQGLKEGSIFCLLIPDHEHESFFNKYKNLIDSKKLFIFAHGYSVSFLNIEIKARKALLAPKAIANYILKHKTTKIPAAIFYQSSKDKKILYSIAKALNFYPLINISFKEEAISDLYTEQSLLCSSVPYLILKIFNKLVEYNIDKNIAVQETLFELTYILDTIKEHGFYTFYKKISPIAFKGSYEFIENLANIKELDLLLDKTLKNIVSKKFNHHNFDKEKAITYFKKEAKVFDATLLNFTKLNKE